jgi:hypothetical protein
MITATQNPFQKRKATVLLARKELPLFCDSEGRSLLGKKSRVRVVRAARTITESDGNIVDSWVEWVVLRWLGGVESEGHRVTAWGIA